MATEYPSNFRIPLPRRARRDHEHAMAWAQTVLTGFERNGWTVRDGWTLDVGSVLDFEATYRDPSERDVTHPPRTVTEQRFREFVGETPEGVLKLPGTVTEQEVAEIKQRFREAVTESGMTVLPSDEARAIALAFDRLTAGGKEEVLTGRADLHYDCSQGWVTV